MYKLIGHSLTRGAWFEPESLPTILTERNSTCTITLGPDGPDFSIDDWILDHVQDEDIVWRVKSVRAIIDEETRSIELEHVIQTLDDICLFEDEEEPEEGEEAEPEPEMTAREAVEYLLSKQSIWVLGDFDYNISNPYEFQKETLLDALENVSETLEDPVWEYNLTVFPFVLHIRRRNTAVSCEMRGGRNLSTLQRTVNRGNMYTRFYPVGKENLRISGDYVSQNENLYGRIDKIESDSSKSTEDSLRAWALGRLRRHCEPEVNIQISGLELSAETGESLDRLKLNRVCRCPLPEFGTTIAEKITKLQWRDRMKEPEAVQVTLCNNTEDVASILRKEKRNGTSGKAGTEQAVQNSAYRKNDQRLFYEFFDECGHLHSQLEMTAASLRIGFDNLNNSTRSEFLMTAESMRIRFENEIQSTRSEFLMTSESMRIRFENEITSTRSQITVTSQSLRSEFENTAQSLRSAITQEAGRISMVVEGYGESASVKRAAIILAINGEGGSTAHIDADEVYIGNTKSTTVISGKLDTNSLTAALIQAKIADLTLLSANALSVAGGINGSGTLTVAGLTTLNGSLRLGSGNSFSSCIVKAEVDSNTLKLTDSGGNVTNFSKATSVSGSWSGTTFNYSATQNGVAVASSSTGVTLNLTGSANIIGASVSSGGTTLDSKGAQLVENTSDKKVYCNLTGGSGSTIAQVSTENTYNAGSSAGYASGRASVTVGVSISYSSAFHVYVANALGSNGATDSETSGHEAYDDGYKAGYNAALSDAGVPNGGTVYTGTWYGTLYVAPTGGAQAVRNCVGGASSHQLSTK